jgi:hypothetical protein
MTNVLMKGHAYFIVLNEGDVYQAEYRGWHAESGCFWFLPLPFALAVNGPQWVYAPRIRVLIDLHVDLGQPSVSPRQFKEALDALLEDKKQ